MSKLDVAVGEAVSNAKEAYKNAEKSPIDHGFAHIAGIDGRTSLASALENHPDINTEYWDHVTIDGVSRYLSPQQSAYRKFVQTLEDYDIDTDGIYVSGRLD